MKMRIVAWLLVLCMVFAMLPVTAFADEITYIEDQSFTFINPLYADTITEDDLVKPDPITPFSTYASRNGYCDATTASELVRDGLVAREKTIIVNACCDFNSMDTVYQDMENLVENVLDAAMVHTGNPIEGDYLRWQYAGCHYEVTDAWTDGISLNMTIEYTMTYYTSATQEAQLDAAVSKLLSQLNVSDLSDYGKLKTIYDYITSHVTYDYANLNDDSYKLKFTAYAALMPFMKSFQTSLKKILQLQRLLFQNLLMLQEQGKLQDVQEKPQEENHLLKATHFPVSLQTVLKTIPQKLKSTS